MKILFVISEIILSEPLGVMQLSAVCKKHGHSTKILSLKNHNILKVLAEFSPDLVAYSTMSADANLFLEADQKIRQWSADGKKKTTRIMGGPHPTYFSEIILQSDLDAICLGEGDNAILNILNRLEHGQDLNNIPNVMLKNQSDFPKELLQDLDALPFPDRDVFYEAAPHYRLIGLRSVLTSRGCPYHCTYCFNHTFNQIFKGCGPVIRRRSVDNVLRELHYLMDNYQPVKLIRFADDTFAHKIDDWLLDFLKRYKQEIGLPFYCLMRSNTLTEEMAKLLKEAGCHSISMSIETGNESVRNNILKRNLSDEVVIKSFANAKKYKIKTHANTMLGLPGTTLKQDYESFEFVKKIKPSLASFFIFCPYPKLELTDYALKNGLFDGVYPERLKYVSKSILNCYTEPEKEVQLRLANLAGIFCYLPDAWKPLLKLLLKIKLNKLYILLGWLYLLRGYYFVVFPHIYPRNPFLLLKVFFESLKYAEIKGK